MCVCGSWEFSGPPHLISPQPHYHLLEFLAPPSWAVGALTDLLFVYNINMCPTLSKAPTICPCDHMCRLPSVADNLLKYLQMSTYCVFSLLNWYRVQSNQLINKLFKTHTQSTFWPPNVVYSYQQHHLGNPIHLLYLLISWTDIPDSTVRYCVWLVIQSDVWESSFTHTPPPICITASPLRKCLFLRLSIPSFALGTGLVDTLGVMMTFTKPHPSYLSTNGISPYCLVPPFFMQARWFLAKPHEDSLCSFSVPTDP